MQAMKIFNKSLRVGGFYKIPQSKLSSTST